MGVTGLEPVTSSLSICAVPFLEISKCYQYSTYKNHFVAHLPFFLPFGLQNGLQNC